MEYSFTQLAMIVLGAVLVVTLLFKSFFTVSQQDAAVVERLGKFLRIAGAGLHFKIPFIDQVIGHYSLRTEQLDVEVTTKTKDNVFVKIVVAVQNAVMPDKVYDAAYQLDDAEKQIESFVFDVVRAVVPTMKLDELFEKKDEIADKVKETLGQKVQDFGYTISDALVTEIDPDATVKTAMNEINAAQRLREAAAEKAEANRIMIVGNAKAESESKKLQGEGIAAQRKAIADGLKESVEALKGAAGDSVSSEEILQILMLTQYFDVLKELGTGAGSKVLFMPHTPGGLADLTGQLRNAVLSANEASAPAATSAAPAKTEAPATAKA